MKLPRRAFLHLPAAAAALAARPRIAWAQTYPARPLRWIVGFPPGGGADTVARILGPWLSERLGQQVVIENRPGASTNIAAQAVVNSPPDGYTLLFYGASTLINTSIFQNLPFNVQRDIAPVSGLVVYPMLLVAHPSLPARSVAELITYAEANPGKVTMASFGTGSASHLAGELFKMMAGIDMVHVPYRGGAPMVSNLIGGQVQVAFDVMVTSLPHVRTGALRALGVAGKNRYEMLPDVPSIAETLPGYEARTWAGSRRAERYAAGNHRAAQPRDQCGAGRSDHQGATRRGRHHPHDLHRCGVRRSYRGRIREMGQSGEIRGHQTGVIRAHVVSTRRAAARDRGLMSPGTSARCADVFNCPKIRSPAASQLRAQSR